MSFAVLNLVHEFKRKYSLGVVVCPAQNDKRNQRDHRKYKKDRTKATPTATTEKKDEHDTVSG